MKAEKHASILPLAVNHFSHPEIHSIFKHLFGMKRKINEIPMDVGFYKNLKHQKNQTVSNWGLVYRDELLLLQKIWHVRHIACTQSKKCASNKKFYGNNIPFPEQENKFNHHAFAM